jgi:hypothetical protein
VKLAATTGKGRESAEEDFQILKRGDEQVLNLLAPQATPAGSLEAMLNGSFAEVAFLEPLASLTVAPSGRSVRLPSGSVEEFLTGVTFEGAPRFGSSAGADQRAGRTHSGSRAILKVAAPRVVVMPGQSLTCRAREIVTLRIVGEMLFSIDALLPRVA